MTKLSEIAPQASGGWSAPFLDGEAKRAAIGSVFDVKAVEFDADNMYGSRWLVGVEDLATGGRWTIGLRSNPGRDRVMKAIRIALDEGLQLDPVIFTFVGGGREGNAPYGFMDASPEVVAKAQADRAEFENRKIVNEALGEA
jgi:hypothetical protein